MAVLIVLWGSAFALIEIAVRDLSPAVLVFCRLLLGGAALALVARLSGARMPSPLQWREPAWRGVFMVALFGNALPFVMVAWAQKEVTSSLSAILVATTPIWTTTFAHLVTPDEKMTPLSLLGTVIGFAGVVVLVGPASLADLGGPTAAAQFAVLGAAVCYSVSTLSARALPAADPLGSAASMNLLAAAMVAPAALWLQPDWTGPVSAWAAMAGLALGSTGIAAVLYLRTAARAGANFIALGNYFVPVLASVIGWLAFRDQLSANVYIAAAMILFGVWLARRG